MNWEEEANELRKMKRRANIGMAVSFSLAIIGTIVVIVLLVM